VGVLQRSIGLQPRHEVSSIGPRRRLQRLFRGFSADTLTGHGLYNLGSGHEKTSAMHA